MNKTSERIRDMLFELSELKAKARTSKEYELADESLAALRAKWEVFCKKPVTREIV